MVMLKHYLVSYVMYSFVMDFYVFIVEHMVARVHNVLLMAAMHLLL